MKLTSGNLVAFALVAIAPMLFLHFGCSRNEAPVEAEGTSPDPTFARAEDPAYMKSLEERQSARSELESTRYRLVSRMEAMIAAAKQRLGTEDEDVLKVELEKDPEWNSLYGRVVDLNKALEDEHRRAAAVVRDKIFADNQKEPTAK